MDQPSSTPPQSPISENAISSTTPKLTNEPPVFKPPGDKPKSKLVSILVFLLILALGAAGYFGWQNYQLRLEKNKVSDIQPTTSPTFELDGTADWQIYTSHTDNYSFKYPTDWEVISSGAIEPQPKNITVDVQAGTVEEVIEKKGIGSINLTDNIIGGILIKRGSFLTVYGKEVALMPKSGKIVVVTATIGLDKEGALINSQVETFDQILPTFKFIDEINKGKTCEDTDGLDYYTKGELTVCDFETFEEPGATSPVGCALHEDFCPTDFDDPTGKELYEYYCEGNILKSEKYICPNGCQNGICID